MYFQRHACGQTDRQTDTLITIFRSFSRNGVTMPGDTGCKSLYPITTTTTDKWSKNFDERPHRPRTCQPRRVSPFWDRALAVMRCSLRISLQPVLLQRLLLTQPNAFQWGTTLKIVPFPRERSAPHPPNAHPSPQRKRHIDWFIRFCRLTIVSYRQTDRQTDRNTDNAISVARGCIFALRACDAA